MARPKLGENKKNNRISIFYTDTEFKQVCWKAASAGLDSVEFLRRLSLETEVKGQLFIPEINKEAAQNLTGGIALLNEAVRLIHTGLAERLPEELLMGLRQELKQTRDALLGRGN